MILEQTFQFIQTHYKSELENLIISDLRVGIFLTAVQLSDGNCGTASTIINSSLSCHKKNRDFGNFTPTKIIGQKVSDLFENDYPVKIIDSLKLAVLNAVSARIIAQSNYKILEKTDPIDLIDLSGEKTITIVGAFQSYINKIATTKNKLFVLELDENAFKTEHRRYYIPAENFHSVIPVSDIVIITGLTLVNHTLDGLLEAISPGTQVIVTGPSSSVIPNILFQNKVNIIGATRITNGDKLMEVVGEGGSVYHLFKYCAEKICIVNE